MDVGADGAVLYGFGRTAVNGHHHTPWLQNWTKLDELIGEWQSRLYVATTQDTTSSEAEAALNQFMADIYPHIQTAENNLKQRLLQRSLQPTGLEIALQ